MQLRNSVVILPSLLLHDLHSYGAAHALLWVSAVLLLSSILLLLTRLAAHGRCLVDSMEPLS